MSGEVIADDPTQLSKRRKHLENMKGQQTTQKSKISQSWTESNDDLTVRLKVEGFNENQASMLDVAFADSDVVVKLPDGQTLTIPFFAEICREKSQVKVKKQRITLHMKKKLCKKWNRLERETVSLPTDVDQTNISLPNVADCKMEDASCDIVDVPRSYSNGHGLAIPQASSGSTDIRDESHEDVSDKSVDDSEEKFVKDEESVIELTHVKHDFMEKDDKITVHIYVKEVVKDSLKVQFDTKTLKVKFQSRNSKFLEINPGSGDETNFLWRINLKGEIVKDKCTFKCSNTLIELTVFKKDFKRWGDLEDLMRPVVPVSSSSSDWEPIQSVDTKSRVRTSTDDHNPSSNLSSPSRGNLAFNEMVESITRENLNQKPPDGGLSASTSKESLQKPTAKVQPLSSQAEEKAMVVTPGYTGLENLGNTCFMNGVLQCLVNIREFKDFFLNGDFQKDLNIENVLGSGGKLAVAFAVLCKVLWSGKFYSYAPAKLKKLVAQKASQFTGFAQHDAQEFMAFLLDGLHEDLNRVKKKPYTETVEDRGRPDEVVADEAWNVHRRRNNSFIVDLFQGQYKSKLVCPVCGKVSITFDPFLYLSLPLPKQKRLLPVTFMWKDPYKKPIRYMLRLAKEATVEVMKEQLHKKTGVDPNDIRIFETYKGRVQKTFGRFSSLTNVQASDMIIAAEVLSEELAGEPVYEVVIMQRTLVPTLFPTRCGYCRKLCPEGEKLKRCSKCFKAGYCDQTCQKNDWHMHKQHCSILPEPVGTPFIISVPQSQATFAKLCQLMESYARFSVEFFQPPVKAELPRKLSSHPSSSNLSSSSQSSGSQTSLDSQSSISSTCTITAEQEQETLDMESPELLEAKIPDVPDSAMMSLPVMSDSLATGTSLPGQNESDLGGELSACDNPTGFNRTVMSDDNLCLNVNQQPDSGYNSVSDLCSTASGVSTAATNSEFHQQRFGVGDSSVLASPVRPVLGIQSSEVDRPTPMFFIKPSNSEGMGLTGPEGERLADKGDKPLDLSENYFLAMDWKNNDKLPGYVLVQTKELETVQDISMKTATAEESNISLDQCLEMFTEPEMLSPEEAWYCPQCKEHREATKQLSTWRLPHILIIQLKRFSFRNFLWRDKLDKMVDFPTRGLDMSSYYVGSRPRDEPPPIYDLYGVVNHHGGILGGHYTSYVRCADKSNTGQSEVGWRLCDDSRVSTVNHEKAVVTKAAYLLFYRRRKVFVPPPSVGLETETLVDEELDYAAEEIGEEGNFYSSDNGPDNLAEGRSGRLEIDTTSSSNLEELPELDLDDDEKKDDVFENDLNNDDNKPELEYTDMDAVD